VKPKDAQFVGALVKAGCAFVAAKRKDPSEKGKALAEYLRSDQPLDEEQRELLSQLVLGERQRDPAGNGESITHFVTAAKRAGQAFAPASDKDPAVEGQALAEYLRSDSPLGKDERELLAQLVLGDWRKPPHRPTYGAGSNRIMAIVAHYRQLVAGGMQKSKAKHKTGDKFGIQIDRVNKILKMRADRENMHIKHGGDPKWR
jgi:hypothetical protein